MSQSNSWNTEHNFVHKIVVVNMYMWREDSDFIKITEAFMTKKTLKYQ